LFYFLIDFFVYLFIDLFIHSFFNAQGTQFPRAEKLRKE